MSTVLVIEDVFTDHQLLCLHEDCRRLQTSLGLSAEDLAATSCSVDPFEHTPLPDQHPARSLPEAYLMERFKGGSLDQAAIATFSSIALGIIPSLLRRLLDQPCLFLFSENYIVKPSNSDIAFRWHRDADEQLACFFPACRPPYVSCWCPLSDTSTLNGTLVVSSQASVVRLRYSDLDHMDSAPISDMGLSSAEDPSGESGVPLEVRRGSVVVFSSVEWHRSGGNRSPADRTVFYAQYSFAPIRSSPDDSPLCLAVPCSGNP